MKDWQLILGGLLTLIVAGLFANHYATGFYQADAQRRCRDAMARVVRSINDMADAGAARDLDRLAVEKHATMRSVAEAISLVARQTDSCR